MTDRELARKMVKVESHEGGWSVMVANRARKREVTRMSFLDHLERREALGIARFVRRAIVDALEESKTGRRREVDRRTGGWVVTWNPPFSQIRRYVNGTTKKRRPSRRRQRGYKEDGRLLQFSHTRAKGDITIEGRRGS